MARDDNVDSTAVVARRPTTPWFLAAPALVWLGLFFIAPMYFLARDSLRDGGLSNYTNVFSDYSEVLRRTFWYVLWATVVCILLGYPLAYYITLRAKRSKPLLLGLVILPFFTTYLIRAISWLILLTDIGPVPGVLRSIGFLGDDESVIGTTPAVVGALAYNFLPFMVLPIFVSLEKIDRRLLEAGPDLYASGWRTFRKVTLRLSMPGVFAGTLLTFIPAAGDFINVEFVGTQRQTMIGNIISENFLTPQLRPQMAAISFVLMALILIGVFVYTRALGTEELG